MSNVDAGAWLALGQPSRRQRTQICRREAFRLRPLSQRTAIRLQLLVLPSAQCGVGPVLKLVLMALDQSVGRIQLRSTPGALGGGHLFG